MKDKDFQLEWDNDFKNRCPVGISRESKMIGCFNAREKKGEEQSETKCHRCWREYIEQKDESEIDDTQPELFEFNHE